MLIKSKADYEMARDGFLRIKRANSAVEVREFQRGDVTELVCSLLTTKAYVAEQTRSWLQLTIGEDMELRVTPAENAGGRDARVFLSLHVRTKVESAKRHLSLVEEVPDGAA